MQQSRADVERIVARLALLTARPRDLASLRQTLQQLPDLQTALGAFTQSALLTQLNSQLDCPDALLSLLERAIAPEPAVMVRDGGGDCNRL